MRNRRLARRLLLLAMTWNLLLRPGQAFGEEYTITGITSGGSQTTAWAINENGDVVGDNVVLSPIQLRSYRYRSGVMELFAPLPTATHWMHTQTYAINNNSRAASARENAQGKWGIWIWNTDGTAQELGFLPGGTYG